MLKMQELSQERCSILFELVETNNFIGNNLISLEFE